MQIKWLGHSTFELSDGDVRVLIDPFLKPNNPKATVTAEEVDPTHVLLTHGHTDHVADALAVLKRTGAPVVAITEFAAWLGEQGIEEVHDPNLGGTVEFDWGWVKLVQAFHTNTVQIADPPLPVGPPAGMLVHIGGVTVYHLGDTCLFGDLKLIADRHPVDVALVPIGGHYTMDRNDAAYACGLLNSGDVIPMHYGTFPPIETDAEAFKREVEEGTSS